MCENEPITDEELWVEPPEDLPEQDPKRNHFNEQQPIKKPVEENDD